MCVSFSSPFQLHPMSFAICWSSGLAGLFSPSPSMWKSRVSACQPPWPALKLYTCLGTTPPSTSSKGISRHRYLLPTVALDLFSCLPPNASCHPKWRGKKKKWKCLQPIVWHCLLAHRVKALFCALVCPVSHPNAGEKDCIHLKF